MTTRRRSNIRPAGFAYIFLTLLVSLGAFNSQNNLLFLAFGFSLSLLIISGMVSGVMLMGLRVRRVTPPPGGLVVGERSHITYHLRSTNRFVPAFAIRIAELDPKGLEPIPIVTPRKAKKPRKRSRHAPIDAAGFLAHLAPRESGVIEAACIPTRRGLFTLPGVVIESSFPFGLLDKRIEYDVPGRVLVRPERLAIDPTLVSRIVRTRGRGMSAAASRSRNAPSRHAGEEFYALSAYRAGDEWRRIAWRASARADSALSHGGLLVREHVEQPPTTLWVELDLGAFINSEQDERAIALSAAIIEQAARQHISVGLAIPQAGVSIAPKNAGHGGGGGRRHIETMLDTLAALDIDQVRKTPHATPEHRSRHGATAVVSAGRPDGAASTSAFVIDAARPETYMARSARSREQGGAAS